MGMFHPDMSGYEIQIIKTLALIKILLYFKDYDHPFLKIKGYIIVILKSKVFFSKELILLKNVLFLSELYTHHDLYFIENRYSLNLYDFNKDIIIIIYICKKSHQT